ncbi:MAG: hypothetical protein ACI90V_014376, partial [Bacillariaceae sp.]
MKNQYCRFLLALSPPLLGSTFAFVGSRNSSHSHPIISRHN